MLSRKRYLCFQAQEALLQISSIVYGPLGAMIRYG